MGGINTSLETVEMSLKRLASAVDAVERAADRRLRDEERRATAQEEFALMQDDRSRLAVELDAALDRSRALESANNEAAERLAQAAEAIGRILGQLEPGAD
jgi:hypothetical protein